MTANNNLKALSIKEKFNNIYVLFFTVMTTLMLFSIQGDSEYDIWFLFNTGRYILTNGFTRIEPFTIHENLGYMAQQWLSAVTFYSLYHYIGYWSVILLKGIAAVTISFLLFKICLMSSNNNYKFSAIFSAIAMIGISPFIAMRPTIFSSIIFLLELYLLESYRIKGNKKVLLALPILSLLLINLQCAMWFMLFAFALPYIVEFLIKIPKSLNRFSQIKRSVIPLLLSLCVSIGTAFINPYGLDALLYGFKSYGNESINKIVIEMQPASLSFDKGNVSMFSLATFALTLLIFAALIFSCRKISVSHLCLIAGMAFMTFMSLRNFQLYSIVTAISIASYFKDLPSKNIKNTKYFKTILIILSVLSSLMFVLNCIFLTPTNEEPEILNAITSTIENKDDAIVFADNLGDYLEFNGFKSYLDTRFELFTKNINEKEDILKEYVDLKSGKIYYKDFIEKYNFTHFVCETKIDFYLITCLKNDDDYKLLYESDDFVVFQTLNQGG